MISRPTLGNSDWWIFVYISNVFMMSLGNEVVGSEPVKLIDHIIFRTCLLLPVSDESH